jgi:DNA invertase Pin-like site-specific DNA recombinase
LKANGCEKIFNEKQSGAKSDREELAKALDYSREGDKLVVYKIDRQARSTFDLHKIVFGHTIIGKLIFSTKG